MKRVRIVSAISTLVLGSACQSHWSIDMDVRGTRVHQAVAVYGKEPGQGARTPPGRGLRFTRDFDGRGPAVFGSGTLVEELRCPLGAVATYRERIGGTTRPAEVATRRIRAADRLADIVATRIETGMRSCSTPADEATTARAVAFLRGDFRADLRDFAVQFRPASLETGPLSDVQAQALVERGYLSANEAAAGVQPLRLLFDSGFATAIARVLSRALGLAPGAPVPAPYASLDLSPESFEATAASMPMLVAALRAEYGAGPTEAASSTAKKTEYFATLLGDALGLLRGLSLGSTTIETSLAMRVDPLETNGRWDREARRIRWPRVAVPTPEDDPLVLHATWAEPDVAEQTARFGSARLDDRALAAYLRWRAGLAPDDAARWDAAVATLKPGPDLKNAIAALRIRDSKDDPVDKGRRILLFALGVPTEGHDTGEDPLK